MSNARKVDGAAVRRRPRRRRTLDADRRSPANRVEPVRQHSCSLCGRTRHRALRNVQMGQVAGPTRPSAQHTDGALPGGLTLVRPHYSRQYALCAYRPPMSPVRRFGYLSSHGLEARPPMPVGRGPPQALEGAFPTAGDERHEPQRASS